MIKIVLLSHIWNICYYCYSEDALNICPLGGIIIDVDIIGLLFYPSPLSNELLVVLFVGIWLSLLIYASLAGDGYYDMLEEDMGLLKF